MTISAWTAVAMSTAVVFAAACAPSSDAPASDASAPHSDASEPSDSPAPHPEEAAVVAAVEQLFEAMRTGDSDMAAAVFHPDARLGRAGEDGISFNPATGFIEAIGRPREQVWDEPVWDWTVQIDGRLAQMWTRYAFYLDDAFSHCGWEGFQLYKADSGWQITQLIDTRHTENCFHPPGREPAGEDAG